MSRLTATTSRLIFAALFISACIAAPAETTGTEKNFSLKFALFSVVPEQGWESCTSYGGGTFSGAGGGGGTVVRDDVRNFQARWNLRANRTDVKTEITVIPGAGDSRTTAATYSVPLTNMQATSLELARNEDGRIYLLNLMPGIEIKDRTPKPLDLESSELHSWKFDSLAILDDEHYLGRVRMSGGSGGSLAYVEIPGIARVEMALKPFLDARPIGTLEKGLLQIKSDAGHTLEFANVKVGPGEGLELPDKIYTVYARWLPIGSEAVAEALKSLEERLAQNLSEAQRNGLEEYKTRIESGHPMIMGNGIGPISIAKRSSAP